MQLVIVPDSLKSLVIVPVPNKSTITCQNDYHSVALRNINNLILAALDKL